MRSKTMDVIRKGDVIMMIADRSIHHREAVDWIQRVIECFDRGLISTDEAGNEIIRVIRTLRFSGERFTTEEHMEMDRITKEAQRRMLEHDQKHMMESFIRTATRLNKEEDSYELYKYYLTVVKQHNEADEKLAKL